VSNDNRATWVNSGAVYTSLISAATAGALTLIPDAAVFGAGSDTTKLTRDIKVTYTNNITG
jgi:hypothetical protein